MKMEGIEADIIKLRSSGIFGNFVVLIRVWYGKQRFDIRRRVQLWKLELFTGKRPTDDMFNDGLTLNNYVFTALPDRVEQIADPTMSLQDNNVLTDSLNQVEQIVDPTTSLQATEGTSSNNTMLQANQSLKIRECLFSIFSIGVACSAQVPSQRMNISDAVVQLRLARGNFSSNLRRLARI